MRVALQRRRTAAPSFAIPSIVLRRSEHAAVETCGSSASHGRWLVRAWDALLRAGVPVLLLAACSTTPTLPALPPAQITAVTVPEAFVTAPTPEEEVDSLALWTAADGTPWLLATAKRGARVLVYDALTGARLGTLAPPAGQEPLLRPNGIAVAGDVAYVVDQQRRRVDLLALPGGQRLGSFGERVLRNPYGIWLRPVDGGVMAYVTDSYRLEGDRMPPPEELGERVRRFLVRPGPPLEARHVDSFGATDHPGLLQTVESIAGDPAHDRLLIAEEQPEAPSGLRVYRLNGSFTGQSLAAGIYRYQAEGVVLIACTDGSGWWVASDQHALDQRFHVFDRASLRWLGAFAGEVARDTDGVAYAPGPLPGFPAGVLYAQHDNQAVVAWGWAEVARALGLPPACPH